MRTLVYDPPPPEFEEILRARARLGQDRWDEVWNGVLHMNPPPSGEHQRLVIRLARLLGPYADDAGLEITAEVGLGHPKDYRVPDVAFHRPPLAEQWFDAAALVIEIASRGDESSEKFDHYAAHGVDEVVIVDPGTRRVDWFALGTDGTYAPSERSGVIATGRADLIARLGYDAARDA